MIEIITEKFSGPLGLLLSLIEREEMDITEINLAKIADDYVAHVKAAEDIDPDELADFLVVAAKLLYIKSKALLPYLYHDSEEDEGDDLERQLRMYKDFIEASEKIKSLIAQEKFSFLPPLIKSRRPSSTEPSFSPPNKIHPLSLKQELERLITQLEKNKEVALEERRLEPKINIEDKIFSIKKMLFEKIKVNFTRLLREAKNKTEVIVSFLAVLELAKQKELIFEQEDLFSDIHILKNQN